jgi:maleamate amidohydrolase
VSWPTLDDGLDAPGSPRVWDSFLTTRDREHAARFPRRARGAGQRPALLMIDVYRGVFGSGPQPLMEAVEDDPASCGLEAWSALPALTRLLQAARENVVPVVHVTGDPVLPRWSDGRDGLPPPSTRREDHYEFMGQVAPIAGEIVLRKSGPSGFWGTSLAGVLVRLGVDSLIVAGESTSGCVRATVVDAAAYGYRVAVVEDCVFDRHQASHAISLFDMNRKYADVVSLQDVSTHLQRRGDDAAS